jgi:isoleucyl-tRNA synthetase
MIEAEGGFTVALDPTITPVLRDEGLARELVSRVQRLRKDSGFQVADRIRIAIRGADALLDAFRTHRDFIMGETLALELDLRPASVTADADADGDGPGNGNGIGPGAHEVNLEGNRITIELDRVTPMAS